MQANLGGLSPLAYHSNGAKEKASIRVSLVGGEALPGRGLLLDKGVHTRICGLSKR
jgi:hypothetical protein